MLFQSLPEDPPRSSLPKLLLPKSERDFGPQTKQRILQRNQILTHLAQFKLIFLFVERDEFANHLYVALGLNGSFNNDRFSRIVRAHRAMRILYEISGLHCIRSGAEINFAAHPKRPDHHHMWPAIRTRRRDPIFPVSLQPVLRPLPRQQAFPALRQAITGYVWPRCSGRLIAYSHRVDPRQESYY